MKFNIADIAKVDLLSVLKRLKIESKNFWLTGLKEIQKD